MHFFFLTRGSKTHVDEVVKFLETRTVGLPFIDKDGKKGVQPLAGMLQPIQLWSYVFPEEYLDTVLNSLNCDNEKRKRWVNNKKMKALTAGLRLMMGAEPLPKVKGNKKFLMPENALQFVSVIPIGIKKDGYGTFENGSTHELI